MRSCVSEPLKSWVHIGRKVNMVILLQLEAMIDFLEARPILALGQLSRTKEGRCLLKKLWRECSEILNCVTANCPKKKPEQWRCFYNEYKSKVLKKVKALQDISSSGSQVSCNALLTPLQERLHSILKGECGDSLKEVCINSVYETEESEDFSPKSDRLKHRSRSITKMIKPSKSINHSINLPKSEDKSNLIQDEFHFFGLNVASQLRQLPLHIALKMQVKIQNDLCKARLDEEDNPLESLGSMLKEEFVEEL